MPEFHGAGLRSVRGLVFVAMCRNLIFHPAPFGTPTARIASPRRDLTIRPAADEGRDFAVKPRRNGGSKSPGRSVAGRSTFGFRCNVQKLDFSPGAVRRSDSTDRLSSTRSNDPSGRGVDRGGLTTICTFLTREPPQGFNEDPQSPISGKI